MLLDLSHSDDMVDVDALDRALAQLLTCRLDAGPQAGAAMLTDLLAVIVRFPLSPPGTGEFGIGHAAASKADVGSLLTGAEKAGAILTRKPHDRPCGIYSACIGRARAARDQPGHHSQPSRTEWKD